jgi:DNA (cytosine-5)-methyltransferase 1
MTEQRRPLTVGSLFSGIDGIGLACERAGMTIAWQCEIDPAANRVLARHWPDVQRFSDVREMNGSITPTVDVLVGGFPCQDVSVAGQRAGLAGDRTGLFYEIVLLARDLIPAWMLLENVPGLLSSNAGRDFGAILGELAGLGYSVAWRVLDAQFFGVAQRRRRVFLVCHLGERAAPWAVLFEPESCRRNPAPRREAGERTARTLTAGVAATRGVNPPGRRGEDDDNLGEDDDNLVPVVAGTLRASLGRRAGQADGSDAGDLLIPMVAGADSARYGKGINTTADDGAVIPFDLTQVTSGANRQRLEPGPPAACRHAAGGAHVLSIKDGMRPRAYGGSGDVSDGAMYTLDTFGEHADGVLAFDWQSGVGVSVDEHTGMTLTTSQTPAALASGSVRRLTPVECERLQGYDDGWTAGESDSSRYRLLGNSVAVPCVEWITRRIAQYGHVREVAA